MSLTESEIIEDHESFLALVRASLERFSDRVDAVEMEVTFKERSLIYRIELKTEGRPG